MNDVPTHEQISAGGVAFRRRAQQTEIALIRVGDSEPRWQLPKGVIEVNESPEAAALREVREEAGIHTEIVAPLDVVEYWYYGRGGRVRYHKFVHFFLLRYTTGDVANHDHEVREARWVNIEQAQKMLAFEGEKRVAGLAAEMLLSQR